MATTKPDKVRATQAFVCDVDDTRVVVHAGDVVKANHAVVKGREALFEPAGADAPVTHE
jgi:hypothetical protein